MDRVKFATSSCIINCCGINKGPETRRCTIDSLQLAHHVAQAALSKKGEQVVILNIGEHSSVADYFVLASASSERQVGALADAISTQLKELDEKPLSIEGMGSPWVLVDFGDVIAHVFHEEARFYYDLDGLWHNAERVEVQDQATANPA